MMKHTVSLAAVALAGLFVLLFFSGRSPPKELDAVASRVGMSTDDLMAIGPRVASQTGATLGTSRQVVYLLACSGMPTALTMEAQATQAAALVEKERLSGFEAVRSVLGVKADLPGRIGAQDC